MAQDREIELKLEVDDAAARLLQDLPMIGEGVSKQLDATYYDTPDAALRDAGVSFRVRRSGDAFVQTMKVDREHGAGLFDRAEWERPVADRNPDLSELAGSPVAALLPDGIAWDGLRPAFDVRVGRTTWHVAREGGEVELVFDEGAAFGGGREDHIREIELELRRGEPPLLFAFAREIAERVPVRVGVLTKAERGFRLLGGADGKAAKAEPVRLRNDMTTAAAFRAIAHACIRHFRLNEPLIERVRNPSALHQARVALRRLRSALSLFRGVVADAAFEEIRTGLRQLAATLGDARNLDVLIERFGGGAADAATIERLRAERERAYDVVTETLASPRTRLLMLRLVEWVEVGDWRSGEPAQAPAEAFAAGMLDRYRRRVKKRGHSLSKLDPEERHRVRIEAKKLRYAAEFFAALYDGKKAQKRRRSFLFALEALQSNLGTLNDIATGEELAHGLAAKGIELPPAAAGEDPAKLLRAAGRAHDDLVEAKRFWR